MRLPCAVLCILPLLVIMPVTATLAETPAPTPDFRLTFAADGTWRYDGPADLLRPNEEETGRHYAWNITVDGARAIGVIEYPLSAFDVEQAKQVQSRLLAPGHAFPLFHLFPHARLHEADATARLYHLAADEDRATLHLQIPTTSDATLVLERDVAPPIPTLQPVNGTTHNSFRQESRTDEYAIGDLQVRRAGSDDEWVRNPTPDFHVRQRFPIVGLDANTTYEVRGVFTDWSDNAATTPSFTVQTAPLPASIAPGFEVIEPQEGTVLPSGDPVPLAVRLLPGDAPVDINTIRLFVDLEEIGEGYRYENGVLTYTMQRPADGRHVVSVEATTLDGPTGHLRWTFQVGAEESPLPAMPLLLLVALLGLGVRRAGPGRADTSSLAREP